MVNDDDELTFISRDIFLFLPIVHSSRPFEMVCPPLAPLCSRDGHPLLICFFFFGCLKYSLTFRPSASPPLSYLLIYIYHNSPITHLLNRLHVEVEFDAYTIESLFPRHMSQCCKYNVGICKRFFNLISQILNLYTLIKSYSMET
ncbi:hypothetical protein BLOT_015354 [Blomia tropicalis]|nr:hypothetical protein BLOT_015354 [Blomia tropicalis]